MQMEMRSWPGGSHPEAYRDDGVSRNATSIMQKAVELPHMLQGSVLLVCTGGKWALTAQQQK